MKANGVPAVNVACSFWLAVFSLSLGTNAAETPLIGSLAAHEQLWSQFERAQSERYSRTRPLNTKLDQAEAGERELVRQIKDLSARMDELKRERERTPSLSKDEFETTQAFEARRRTATAAYRESAELKIRNQESALETARLGLAAERRAIAEHREGLRVLNEQQVTSQPGVQATSDRLFGVRVRMPSYDADRKCIPNFQLPGRFNAGSRGADDRFAEQYLGPRLFELHGKLSGISVEVEKAKEIRGLSDSGRLLAIFRAKPADVNFDFVSSTTEIIPGKRREEAGETEKMLWAGAAGLLAAAFGGDAAQAAGNARQSMGATDSIFSSPTPDKKKITPIRLIHCRLESATIEALYGWDEPGKEWKLVLKNPTPLPSPLGTSEPAQSGNTTALGRSGKAPSAQNLSLPPSTTAMDSTQNSKGRTACIIDSRPITGIQGVRLDPRTDRVIITWPAGGGSYPREKLSEEFLSSWGVTAPAAKSSKER